MQYLTNANISTPTWATSPSVKEECYFFIFHFLHFIYDYWNCRISKSNLCMCHASNTRWLISQHQVTVSTDATAGMLLGRSWDDGRGRTSWKMVNRDWSMLVKQEWMAREWEGIRQLKRDCRLFKRYIWPNVSCCTSKKTPKPKNTQPQHTNMFSLM